MQLECILSAGLALFIMGIVFLWNRINFIKKGNRTIATVVKLEECIDDESGRKSYIPYFQFTTYNNRGVTYEHDSTLWEFGWKLGEKANVVYKEENLYEHEVLLFTFNNVFGLPTLLLTVGSTLLAAAGGIYWNASGQTFCIIIPVSICLPVLAITIWGNRFIRKIDCQKVDGIIHRDESN